jgi:hypothetical protein
MTLDKIATLKKEEETFDIHDERGNKTGGTKTEIEYSFLIGEKKFKISKYSHGLYMEDMEKDYPGLEFGKYAESMRKHDSTKPSNYFVGVKVVSSEYHSSFSTVENSTFVAKSLEAQRLMKQYFNYTGEVVLILKHYYEC